MDHDTRQSDDPQRVASSSQLHLRFYIAGKAPHSQCAQANLVAICRDLAPKTWRLAVVDVLEAPRQALDDPVLVTPALHRLAPAPEVRLVGDFSDHAHVRLALGLEMEAP